MNTYLIVSREPGARSSGRIFKSLLTAFALAGAIASNAHADVVYNETLMGDLSGDGFFPSSIGLHAGSNQILGTTGNTAAGMDRDYFTVTVPSGFTLNSLIELPGTTSGGVSFLGLEAGPQVTLPTSTFSAAGLLGWIHYSPVNINSNLFPAMSIPSNGSSGFTAPLSAGTYSFWIQDFTSGTFNYGFDLGVVAIPESSAYSVVAGGMALLLTLRFRSLKKAVQV